MQPKPDKKLMVTIKLELKDAVKVKWLSKEKPLGKDFKPRLASLLLSGGAEVEVDSTNVSETTVPDAKSGPDQYSVFFVGYFYIEPTHPNYAKVKGQKDVEVGYKLVFQNKANELAVEGKDYQILEKKKASMSAMG